MRILRLPSETGSFSTSWWSAPSSSILAALVILSMLRGVDVELLSGLDDLLGLATPAPDKPATDSMMACPDWLTCVIDGLEEKWWVCNYCCQGYVGVMCMHVYDCACGSCWSFAWFWFLWVILKMSSLIMEYVHVYYFLIFLSIFIIELENLYYNYNVFFLFKSFP